MNLTKEQLATLLGLCESVYANAVGQGLLSDEQIDTLTALDPNFTTMNDNPVEAVQSLRQIGTIAYEQLLLLLQQAEIEHAINHTENKYRRCTPEECID
ncbi:MAG: hypothetical protein ACRCWQ_04905 [Bacilli bacterium]